MMRRADVLVVLCGLAVLATGWMQTGRCEEAADVDRSTVMLFPIVREGKWGYMDEKGKVVIEPKYDLAFDFSEGLACVAVGPLRGYIDRTGKEVIKPQFGWCSRFSEGYALACIRPKLFGEMVDFYKGSLNWGLIDRTGQVNKNISTSYGRNTEGFREGRIIVVGKACYDLNGKKLEHDADMLGAVFSEGLLPAHKGGKWGYLDLSMKWAIAPQFDGADRFSEGLAAMAVATEGEKRGSRGAVYKFGFIDKSGKTVIEAKFDGVWPFSEGLAAVNVGGKWGYVDTTGKMVIAPQFDHAWPFSEGLGRVLVGEKQGFVNTTGTMVIQPAYEPAWEFSRGLARVGVGRGKDYREGYIDKSGKFVWEPTK